MQTAKQINKLLLNEAKIGNKSIDDLFGRMEKAGFSDKKINDILTSLSEGGYIIIIGNDVHLTPKGYLMSIEHDEVSLSDQLDLEKVIEILTTQGPLSTLSLAKAMKGPNATKGQVNNILYKSLRAGALSKISEDVWDVVSTLKPSRKKADKCFYCKMENPDHSGRDCPMRELKTCMYCRMKKPDHEGYQCPMEPSNLAKQRKKDREMFVAHNGGQQMVFTSVDEVIRDIGSRQSADAANIAPVESDVQAALKSKEMTERILAERLKRIHQESLEDEITGDKWDQASQEAEKIERQWDQAVLESEQLAKFKGYKPEEMMRHFAPFAQQVQPEGNPIETNYATAVESARITESIFQQRLKEIKMKEEKKNMTKSEDLAPQDLEYEFYLYWVRSASTAQYLRSLFLFEFNSDVAKKYTMLGEKVANLNLIKMCIDDNKEQRHIQPYINEHIGANIIGKAQPATMKTDIARIISAAVVRDEGIGRFLYSVLGALFYRRMDFEEAGEIHKRMMAGDLWL